MVNEYERQDLGILLALAYASFVEDLRESLAKSGFDDLHASFGYVARNLAQRPLTLRELADRLGISSPGALKIVRELERTKYVERGADPKDARAIRLRLSKRGRAALAAAKAFHASYERSLVKKHGTRSVTHLRELLDAMIAESTRPNARTVRPI
jgi:DNA-binding MarR family transcriptional regulator